MSKHQILRRLIVLGGGALVAACGNPDGLTKPVGPERPAIPSSPSYSAVSQPGVKFSVILKRGPASVAAEAGRLSSKAGSQIGRQWSHALRGFELYDLSDSAIAVLKADPSVEEVEREADMTVLTDQDLTGIANIWGLDQIDQQVWGQNNLFRYFYPGTGVRIYFVDTGVLGGHQEYTSRRILTGNFGLNGSDPWTDANGHGTRMTGVAAGTTYGVAKGAWIQSVRVMPNGPCSNCSGDVVSGLNWIVQNGTKPAVVNISLGGNSGPTGALPSGVKTAINGLVSAGYVVSLAGGNGGDDGVADQICNSNYSGLPLGVNVVSAVNPAGHRVANAAFGPCVSIFAPGESNATSGNVSNSDVTTTGGTSAATAFVSGVAASILQHMPTASAATIAGLVTTTATGGLLSDLGNPAAPNLFVNSLHLYSAGINGPSQVVTTNPSTQTWTLSSPSGGSGSYTYEWQAAVNYGAYSVVGTSQSYSRYFPRFAQYTLSLKAIVYSGGVSFTSVWTVNVTCGGC